MKKIFKTIKEYFILLEEHFILLLGTGLFIYSLFNFDNRFYKVRPSSIFTYYYYNDTTLIWLTIGAILIVIGLLKMRKKKDEN